MKALGWAVLALFLFQAVPAGADSNPHLVGWLNAAVPGGGQFLLGDPLYGVAQAGAELGTFVWGYSWSAGAPMTLDGVPERVPLPGPLGSPPQDLSRQLYADILQEAGLKYHMVNVFEAYREAGAPNTDQSSTLDLFKAPFRGEVMANPWVWGALAVSAVAITVDGYLALRSGVTPLAPLDARSNALYGVTYGAVYPVGSGAPEEMFYRGFFQNEAQQLVDSPFFSIAASTLAFTFSHATQDRPSAAIAGAYLGFLAYHHKGQLSPGIAYHFWSDVMTGILAVVLLQRAEYGSGSIPPLSFGFRF